MFPLRKIWYYVSTLTFINAFIRDKIIVRFTIIEFNKNLFNVWFYNSTTALVIDGTSFDITITYSRVRTSVDRWHHASARCKSDLHSGLRDPFSSPPFCVWCVCCLMCLRVSMWYTWTTKIVINEDSDNGCASDERDATRRTWLWEIPLFPITIADRNGDN